MQKTKPNILFVFSDQHRFCDAGYHGNPDVVTPNLDRLTREGVWFDSCYSNCPLCVPARGTLFSSRHALTHGAAANDVAVKTGSVPIAHKMTELGYDTAYAGKRHLGGRTFCETTRGTMRILDRSTSRSAGYSPYWNEPASWRTPLSYIRATTAICSAARPAEQAALL